MLQLCVFIFYACGLSEADNFSEWKDVLIYAVRNRKSEKKLMLLLLFLVEREVARFNFQVPVSFFYITKNLRNVTPVTGCRPQQFRHSIQTSTSSIF